MLAPGVGLLDRSRDAFTGRGSSCRPQTTPGLSRVPGFAAWPLSGLGAVAAYLLCGGLDVVLARVAARHTSAGRSG